MSNDELSSDGSLTQDEIDNLLGGDSSSDMADVGATPAPGAAGSFNGGGGALSASEQKVLTGFFSDITSLESSNLSSMMGGESVTISPPEISIIGKEEFFQMVADEVVSNKVNFTGDVTGKHLIVIDTDSALKIAQPLIGQDELTELNDMAVNTVQEAISTMTGPLFTQLGDRTGKNIMPEPALSEKIPKATLDLPVDSFVNISYNVQIDGNGAFPLYEVIPLDTAKEIADLLGGEPDVPASPQMGDPMQQQQMGGMQQPMGGMQQPMGGMQQPMGGMQQQMGGMQQPMGGMQQQMGGMQQPMGGMQQPMGGMQQPMMGMQQPMMGGMMGMPQMPNVQGIQYPSFDPASSTGDQQNINLLMNVFMEVTVELGRTRKQIKEILGMGEGTIIELDKLAGEAVDILVNGQLIANGEVVVIDENFGVRVTSIVSSLEGQLNEQ